MVGGVIGWMWSGIAAGWRITSKWWTGATETRNFPAVKITRQSVARKLQAYLQGRLSQAALVDWAERAMLAGDFAPADAAVLRKVVPKLGLADVRAFGLEWDECAKLLRTLGYKARVEVVAA